MRRGQRLPTYSTAWLDSLVCPVPVDSKELQSCLPKRAGLSLVALPGVPEGQHPLIVEVWRVQNGRIEFGGVTADRLWELAGTAAGLGLGSSAGAAAGAGFGGAAGAAGGGALGMWLGPAGWWWGVVTGATAGAAAGASMAAAAGALRGSRWASYAGHELSRNCSRVIGTYNEILVTVPCRRTQASGSARDFSFVLATYTDSVASMLGESVVGWGYRKSAACGVYTRDGVLEVRTRPSATPFKVVSRPVSSPVPPAFVRSASASLFQSLSYPLLGMLPADRLRVSFMDRFFEHRSVRVAPASVRLESGDAFLPGLRGFARDVKALGNDDPWGAFLVTGLPVRLSYPDDLND